MAVVLKEPDDPALEPVRKNKAKQSIKLGAIDIFRIIIGILSALAGAGIIVFSIYGEIDLIVRGDWSEFILTQPFAMMFFMAGIGLLLCGIGFGIPDTASPVNRKMLKLGALGERQVANILSKLSNEWYVFNDIIINDAQIDHVLVGPKGIFCIETKTWASCAVTPDGKWWEWNKRDRMWYPAHINPAEQNWFHVKALKKLLGDSFIHSIIVLAHPKPRLSITVKTVEPGHARICRHTELLSVITENERTLSSEQVQEVVEKLAGACIPPVGAVSLQQRLS